MAKIEETYQNTAEKLGNAIKTYLFDIIAFFIIIALLVLQLGAVTLETLTWENCAAIIAEAIPFFLFAMLLDTNYYKKGMFVGKGEQKYIRAVESYNTIASLSGEELTVLPQFCAEYNKEALILLQKGILEHAVIDIDKFNNEYTDENGNVCQPIKTLTRKELIAKYGKERAKLILQAKHARCKGLTATELMSSRKTDDNTDIGESEIVVEKKHNGVAAIGWWIGLFLITLITINDITTWGWATIGLVAFKIIYIAARSYMSYFNGYNDITVNVVSHFARKVDVLQQFKYWYAKREEEKKEEKTE